MPTGNFATYSPVVRKTDGPAGDKFICASNENTVLTDFIETCVYDKNATSTDGIALHGHTRFSNSKAFFALSGTTKRFRYMRAARRGEYEVGCKIKKALDKDFAAGYCNDDETRRDKEPLRRERYLIDTHTADAAKVLDGYRKKRAIIPRGRRFHGEPL